MPKVRLERAAAKLTRTLAITGRRSDGYHLLRSEMVALDLYDELVITEDGSGFEIEDAIAWSGGDGTRPALGVPADETNLVLRALTLIEREAAVRLVKRIPPGAGLGGGSADAAAVLRAFGVDDTDLAVALGADVPFCLSGGRALVAGIGEEVTALEDVPLGFVVVTPSFGVSTRAVYDAYDALGEAGDDAANHLERAALVVEPQLVRVRDAIRDACGLVPTLAGSGSSYFVECAPAELETLASIVAGAFQQAEGPVLISTCRSLARRAD